MSKEGETEGEITWLIDKTIKGKPSTFAGCETVCGTKHNWMVGVTPAIDTSEITKTGRYKIKEIWNMVEAYTHQLVVVFNAKTTEGGVCTGSWDSDVSGSHKMKITVRQHRGGKLHEQTELMLVNGLKQYVNINGAGNFTVSASSEEWGEECNEPKGSSKTAFKVSNEPSNMTFYDEYNMQTLGDATHMAESPYAAPLIIGGAVGIMLLIASMFKGDKKV
jgi:hypothetical protein